MAEENISDYLNIWDTTEEEKIPFFKWGISDNVEIEFEKPVKEYPIKEITSKFGKSSYIAVICNKQLNLLRIDSVRLRTAIISVISGVKKFPVRILLSRFGSGFNTNYKAKIN